MLEQLEKIRQEFAEKINEADNVAEVENFVLPTWARRVP